MQQCARAAAMFVEGNVVNVVRMWTAWIVNQPELAPLIDLRSSRLGTAE